MNTKKLTALLLLNLFMALTAYSQQMVLKGNDTLISFTLPQARFLQKQSFELLEQVKISQSMAMQLAYADSLMCADSVIKTAQVQRISNCRITQKIKDAQHQNDSTAWEFEKSDLKKEIRRQKRQKWVAYIVTAGMAVLSIRAQIKK